MLALGCRLNPFGTLPQHGIDYWPRQATIIQIDADARRLGPTKKVQLGICADAKVAAEGLVRLLRAVHGERGSPASRSARVERCA